MTTGSPWFRDTDGPGPEPIPVDPYGHGEQRVSYEPAYEPVREPAYEPAYEPVREPVYEPAYEPVREPVHESAYEPVHEPVYEPVHEPVYEQPQVSPYEPGPTHASAYEPRPAQEAPYEPVNAPYEAEETPRVPRDETMPIRAVEPLPGPGRAERRRAAKGGGGGRGKSRGASPTGPTTPEARPLSRVEARRAAREAKDSVGVVASRIVGELFITFGVVMLLFVTYQLWWTNVRADQQTDRAKEQIADTWAKGDSKPEAFEPGEGFAIMYIPKLDVVVPIAEGINKTKVLDKGMVGHYAEGTLKTAMPSAKQGNFAVAGHRNTHGEPFRYINQLKPGDPIVVETQDAYYTYEMASILPQTAPSNISVIDPVPKGSGFTKPGRFITLTTCTPEFTSTYRMIVWGKMVEERPRSKGKPAALVG
ncbi:class E sortase [Streptomyces sp. NPDC006482]|uniref:class E sortase n=1 Tax=Streptomyces sp. NPDC006482 TaxID=3154306 RepID=UPI0033A8CCEA